MKTNVQPALARSSLVLLGAGIAGTSVAMTLFGSVVAQAASQPNVVGQKYSDASSALSSAGLSVVVSTTVGDTVDRSNCIVTRQQGRTEPAPENTSASPTSLVLLSLNCGAPVASATTSGNSLASPEGRAAAAAAATATPAPSK
jgi:PASTA domain-containing protein